MTISYAINILLFVIPVITTLFMTFHDRIRHPAMPRLFGAVFLFIAASYFGSMLASLLPSTPINHTIIFTASIFVGTLIFYFTIQYRFCQCIFIIAIIKCYVDDVSLTSSFLYFSVKGKLTAAFSQFPVWPLLIVSAIGFPLILLFYKKLLRPALNDTEALPFWSYMWMVPLCSNLLYALCIAPLFSEDTHLGYEFYFVPVLWTLLCFATFAILLRGVTDVAQKINLQTQLHISELYMSAQQKQVQTLQNHIEHTRRERHDLRHHILVMKGLIAQKDYIHLSEYLDEYHHQIDMYSPVSYTDNAILNTLLSYYCELAKSNGICTDISVMLNQELPVSNMDICIILGNLFENAIEACCRQTMGKRFITLKITMKSPTILVLIMENSYEGMIRKKDDIFLSSKKEDRHGIGIASVQHLVKHYHGVCKIHYEHQIFSIMLLLNKPTI